MGNCENQCLSKPESEAMVLEPGYATPSFRARYAHLISTKDEEDHANSSRPDSSPVNDRSGSVLSSMKKQTSVVPGESASLSTGQGGRGAHRRQSGGQGLPSVSNKCYTKKDSETPNAEFVISPKVILKHTALGDDSVVSERGRVGSGSIREGSCSDSRRSGRQSLTGRQSLVAQQPLPAVTEDIPARQPAEEATGPVLQRQSQILKQAGGSKECERIRNLGEIEKGGLESQPPWLTEEGSRYCGDRVEGRGRHGQGRQEWPDGSSYEGQWQDDKAHGKGKFVHANGDWYEGDWVDDKAEGEGEFFSPTTDYSYKGRWSNDQQQGKGVEVWKGRLTFEGSFFRGNKHGSGKLTLEDGSKYEGGFRSNQIEGFGHYVWPDGREYTGHWLQNKQSGSGMLRWPDGQLFEGTWVDGRRSGRGKITKADGSVVEGVWVNGEMTLAQSNL